MLDPTRIRSRMEELNVSQAKLAKRVGVSQQTIGRLVTGGTFGSRYLHLIARELNTTPEYLTGEIDDPAIDAATGAAMSADESDLVEMFRGLQPRDRAAILQLTRSLAHSAVTPVLQADRSEFKRQ